MTKVKITMDVYPECADPDDQTGVTEQTFMELFTKLADYGDDIQIEKDEL